MNTSTNNELYARNPVPEDGIKDRHVCGLCFAGIFVIVLRLLELLKRVKETCC